MCVCLCGGHGGAGGGNDGCVCGRMGGDACACQHVLHHTNETVNELTAILTNKQKTAIIIHKQSVCMLNISGAVSV